jgi:hypothetical protein
MYEISYSQLNVNCFSIEIELRCANSGRQVNNYKFSLRLLPDRLCSLVFRIPGYRSRGPGSIPGATKFSEK